jgi:hypothetical protein
MMPRRNWMLFGLLAALPCIYFVALARAADPPPSKSDKDAAADDQFAPQNPPPRRNGRGPAVPADPSVRPPAGNNPFEQGRGPNPPMYYGPSGQPNWPQGGMPGMGGVRGGRGPMGPSDPEMEKLMQTDFNLDRQSHELAEQYNQASKDKRDEIKKQLAELVTKQFEARQERRTLELKRLEDEINRIRESIDKRNKGKQLIVDRRVSELLGQDDNSF